MIDSIIGHADAVTALNRSLVEGRLAHAYLFAGPEGVGKRTLALELAKAVTCTGPDAPCNVCSACRRIDAGKHPDVELMAPGGICEESDHDHSADAGRDIRICQVRRAERVLGITPFEGGRRVLILDPAEAMNAQSADAFLKTLEEPPNGALIILITANDEQLGETVRSRCRRVPLCALRPAETERALAERFGATPEQSARLTRLFAGRIGCAVEALRDPHFEERRTAMLDHAARVPFLPIDERFDLAGQCADAFARRDRAKPDETGQPVTSTASKDGRPRSRTDVYATLDAWIEWWRDILLVGGGADAAVVNAERAADLYAGAGALGIEAAARGISALREARHDLEHNINPRLALEALMLRLPRGNQEADPSSRGAPQLDPRPIPDSQLPTPTPGG